MKTHLHLLRRFALPATVLIGLGASLGQAQPANDMFANRIVITGTNIVVTGSSASATKETGEPSHGGNTGGASVWWSWNAPRSDTFTISTAGSSFDTLLGVYTGTSVSALTTIASNDDEHGGAGIYTSKVVFGAVANQTYQIAVDGYGGASGNIKLLVQLGAAPLPAAPAWNLPDQNGVMIHSTNFAGKVVMLDFWGTTCGYCIAEMPDLVALQDKYRADGLAIVGADVSWWNDSAQAVQNFLATYTPTLNYQIVMSTAANEAACGGISGVPTTFIIDRQNFIREEFVGQQSRSTLESQIIPLLYCNTRLACQRSGNQMTFRWATNAVTFTLESANTLNSPTWSAWPTSPTVVNGTNTVQVPTTNAARCFRLRTSY
jgi:thiol-disulfide isomerase/thioredoxin